MSDLLRSVIRTGVPALVGILVALVADNGLDIDQSVVVALTAWLSGVGYYIAARVAEASLNPKWGWLLGAVGAPEYVQTVDLSGDGHTV